MNATAHTNFARHSAPTVKPIGMRARMIAGVVFAMSFIVLLSVTCVTALDLKATALPDDWPRLEKERRFRPDPVHTANVTISARFRDIPRFMNFLAHDAARHGGHVESLRRTSVDYVVPRWYYEELRRLEFEQSASTDADSSIYADWTKKMAAIPDRTEDGSLTTMEVGFVGQLHLIPWPYVGLSFVFAGLALILMLVSTMVIFDPCPKDDSNRKRHDLRGSQSAGGDVLEEQIAEAEKMRKEDVQR